ncbi:MAG: primosomal protein N' [Dehalococcoidia bacterium]|nr:primosomal protein N' [Dehalococcoidia bacterium]
MSPAFADVAVNSGMPARRPFTYAVPDGMAVVPGQAVFVPYGPRVLQGIVMGVSGETELPPDQVRPIQALAEPAPVLDAVHTQLAAWISETYLAPLWDCVATCLPSGYGQKPVTMVSPVEIPPLLPVYPKDQKILQYVAAHGQVAIDELREAVGSVSMSTLQRLQRDGHLTVVQGLARPSGRFRYERRIRLLRTPEEAEARAAELAAKSPKAVAARVLRLLAIHRDVPLADVRATGAQPGHVKALAGDGWLEEHEERVERDPLADFRFQSRAELRLAPAQQAAVEAITTGPQVHLLHGITGSGKTEVYLELVARALAAGQSAIVLVPEISLTPQAIRRYGERFPDVLTVLHSGLGTGELFDQWYRVKRGDARLVIGSRSAIFAPAQDLGLVVLDEEHEWSYKQADPSPRYHARDVAGELCRLTGARLVLGSATPDIVTYHRSEVGAIGRVELLERVVAGDDGELGVGRLPQITVVDMREELKTGNRGVFSFALRRAMRIALDHGEQSILFVNRRGSARFMLCRDCGYLPLCPACEVAMSLDLADPSRPMLRCHHCGRHKRLEERCPKCDSAKYRPFGVGTQRIELEAQRAFPSARVARWDSDVASRKGSHERMVHALEAGEIDILVGTQMLAKGLDLPQMTVVGVVDADVGLSLPDFHAHERTFQLLSQVSGRAGRRERDGFVYFQTYEPDAAPIVCAANHDYRAFYEDEIAHRRRAGYPPFSRMVRLVHRNGNYEHGLQEASRVAADLRLQRDAAGRAEPDILGPTPTYIARVRGEYRWQVLLRGRNPAQLVASARLGERWTVDVDPASLL